MEEKYSLDLSGEALDALPTHLARNFQLLSFLTELRLQNNLFVAVPRELAECIKLKVQLLLFPPSVRRSDDVN